MAMHILKLGNITKEVLKNGSSNLVTRETGKIVLVRIEQEVQKINNGEILVLDFSDVGIIDFSCADEVIAKLLARFKIGEYGEKYIAIKNLTSTQRENIQAALEKRDLAVISFDNNRKWQIVGTLNNYLFETLEAIMKPGKISTRELSDKLKLELNTASTRLLNLHKAKLVQKCEEKTSNGRRQFVYKSLLIRLGG